MRNKGKGAATDDIAVRIRTEDQPVFSSDTDTDVLTEAQNASITYFTIWDSNATEQTYFTLKDTARGQIPADGYIKVTVPSNFTLGTVNTSNVQVYEENTLINLANNGVSTSDSVVTIQLDAVGVIEDGNEIMINIGTASSPSITNPTIYNGTTLLDSAAVYSTAHTFGVWGLDADGDTIFFDSLGTGINPANPDDITQRIVSNYWVHEDNGTGGVKLSNVTASNATNITLRFQLGNRLDSILAVGMDTLALDLSNFEISGANVKDSTNYVFTGGGNLLAASENFEIDTTNLGTDSYVYIYMKNDGYLPNLTTLQLVISNVLTNRGQTADADIRIRTNHQTSWVTDRDVVEILPNTGGIITELALSDTNASARSVIDSLVFITSGTIPNDGQIVIVAPTAFTINSSLDSASITKGDSRTLVGELVSNGPGGISSIAVDDYEVALNLNLSSDIAAQETLFIMLGDTSYGADRSKTGTQQYAFTNPAAADSGWYPTQGSARGKFYVRTKYNDSEGGGIVQEGTNDTRRLRIVTNTFVDSEFVFEAPIGINSQTNAGDSVGIYLSLKLGSPLIGKEDTLYINLSNFAVDIEAVKDSANVRVSGGVALIADGGTIPTYENWDSTAFLIGTTDTLAIVGHGSDTLSNHPDSTVIVHILGAGAANNYSEPLHNRGANSDVDITIWTSNQFRETVTSDVSRDVLARYEQVDTTSFVRFPVMSDSSAGEVSTDSFFISVKPMILPGSKISLKLKEGFSFTSGVATTAGAVYLRRGSDDEFGSGYVDLSPTAVDQDDITLFNTDSLVITIPAGDTIANITGQLDQLDTLLILVGDGTQGITNIHPDSVLANALDQRRARFGGTIGYVYDPQERLMYSTDSTFSDLINVNDSLTVVSNVFAGEGLKLRSTAHPASPLVPVTMDTAGKRVDTLCIPIKIGQTLIGNGATVKLNIKVRGLIFDTDSLIKTTNYAFEGDTGGTADLTGLLFSNVTDTTVTITLATGDTLGQGNTTGNAPDTAFFVEMKMVDIARALGNTGTGDDVDVLVWTNYQSSEAIDATNTVLDPGYASAPDAITFSGPSYGEAGQNDKLFFKWQSGTFHGYIPEKGKIEVYLPTYDNSDYGAHEFAVDVSGLSSTNVRISSYDSLIAASNVNLNSASFDTAVTGTFYTSVNYDTTGIVIDFTTGNTVSIEQDSSVVVAIGAGIRNALRANVKPANTPFHPVRKTDLDSASVQTPARYGYKLQIKDQFDGLISRIEGDLPPVATNNMGSPTQVLVLMQGQHHDPGHTAIDSCVWGSVRSDTVNEGVDFQVLLTDDYGNRDTTITTGVVTLTSPLDNFEFYNGSQTSSGVIGLGYSPEGGLFGGLAEYLDDDSLLFLTAKDDSAKYSVSGTNSERGAKHTIRAAYSAISGISDSIAVAAAEFKRVFIRLSGESFVPGDTLNRGKTGSPTQASVDFANDGVTDVVIFAVDTFYNRTAGPTTIALDSLRSNNTGARMFDASTGSEIAQGAALAYTFDSDSGVYRFKLRAGNTAEEALIYAYASRNSGAIKYSHSAYFDVVAVVLQALFEALDITTDALGDTFDYTFKAAYSGMFASGEGWTIWAFPDTGESYMDSQKGIEIASGLTTGQGDGSTLVNYNGKAYSRPLSEGSKYWLYATHPVGQGDSVRAISSGIIIRHEPVVDSTRITPTATDGNIILNSSGTYTQNLKFFTRDLNTNNVEVKVFLNSSAVLGDGDVTFKGTSPFDSVNTIGTGSIQLASGTILGKNDSLITMNIISPTYMTKGDYYIYVVANDGDTTHAYKSNSRITVKHTPTITLDRPTTGTQTIDTKDQKKITISWTIAGDQDRDDNATIAIFMDTLNMDHSTADRFFDDTTHAINLTGGFTKNEDADGDSDMYVFDLTRLTETQINRTNNAKYKFYALIKDDRDTLISESPGTVLLKHTPRFKFKLNFGGAISKSAGAGALGSDQIKIQKGDVFRFDWESYAYGLSSGLYVRLVASPLDDANYWDMTFSNEAAQPDESPTTNAWIINSSDGSENNVVSLTTDDTYYDWYTENMTDFTNTVIGDVEEDFYIYAFIATDGNATTASFDNPATSQRSTANGRLNVSGLDRTVVEANVRIEPNVVALTKNETQTLSIKINSKGDNIQGVFISFDVPDTLVTIVDQSSTYGGIQPFIFPSNAFLGSDTLSTGGSAVYNSSTGKYEFNLKFFEEDGVSVNADTVVAQIQITSKGTEYVNSDEELVYFLSDPDNNRNTKFTYRDQDITAVVSSPAFKVRTTPEARITGNIPLEGRSANFSKEITLELREIGSLLPIDNSTFDNANDQNSGVAGVQITTDADGRYELSNVPTGTYDLVAKTSNYLAGEYYAADVVSGDYLIGINPTKNLPTVDYQELLGGDVSSSTSTGTQDNTVDGDDIQFIKNQYLKDTTQTGYGEVGDIDGDGTIGLSDLLITSSNLNRQGVPPVFNQKVPGKDNSGAKMKFMEIPELVFEGDEFDVNVLVENIADLKGYQFTVKYDPNKYEWLYVDEAESEGDFLRSVNPGVDGTVFFSTDDRKGKVYVSTLLGRGETAEGSGMLATIRFKSKVDGETPDIRLTDIYVGNSSNSLTKLSEVVNLPSDFKLSQNFPNPFNPITNIRFQLPEASKVTLKIYNILGQEIKTLVNKNMDAGFHSFKWQGTNDRGIKVASGVYIYRIK
ncbi:FlgD immunoglobulin-like domain containing protein, partial [candidate division KSB1 bacterium]